MANKYSNVRMQPYTSQYVSTGKVEASKILRDRWDKGRADHDSLTRAANTIQVGGGDMHLRDEAIDNVRKNFEGVVESNNYEDSNRVVSDATTQFLSNEGLQLAAESYRIHRKEEEQKSALELQGQNVLFTEEFVRDEEGNIVRNEKGIPQKQSKFDNHKSFYVDENGKTVRNIYKGQAAKQFVYSDRQASIIGNIAKDPVALQRLASLSGVGASEVQGFLVSGSGVSMEKANRIADSLLDEYLETPEGRQQMRKLTEEDIDPATGNTYDAYDAELKIQAELRDIASTQEGQALTYTQDPTYISIMEQNSAPVKARLETYMSKVQQNAKVLTGTDFIDLATDFDAKGNIKSTTYTGDWLIQMLPLSARDVHKNFLFNDFKERGLEAGPASVKAKKVQDEAEAEYAAEFGVPKTKKEKAERDKALYSNDDDRALVRVTREMNAAAAEGRSPKAHILSSHKGAYIKYMRNKLDGLGYPTEGTVSDKEFVEKLSSGMEEYEITSRKILAATNINIAGKSQELLAASTVWHIRREDGSITKDKDEALIELGYKDGKLNWKAGAEEAYRKYMATPSARIAGIMPNGGASPGSYLMTMRTFAGDGNRKDREVEIAAGTEQSAMFAAPHRIMKELLSGNAYNHIGADNSYSLEDGLTTATNGDTYGVNVSVHYDIDPETFSYVPVITHTYIDLETNEPIKSEFTKGMAALEARLALAETAFMNSGLVGSDLKVNKNSESSNPSK